MPGTLPSLAKSCVVSCRGEDDGHASRDCASDIVVGDSGLKTTSALTIPKQVGFADGRLLGQEDVFKMKNVDLHTHFLPVIKPQAKCAMPVLVAKPPTSPPDLTQNCQRVVISRRPDKSFGLTLDGCLMPSLRGVSVRLPRQLELPLEGTNVLKVHSGENDASVVEGDLIVKVLKVNAMDTSELHATSLQMLEWMRVATDLEVMVLKQKPKRLSHRISLDA